MTNNILFANDGSYGTKTAGNVGSLMQGQTGVVMLFTLQDLAGTAIDISSYTVTGKLSQKQDDNTYITAALTGATAVTANAASGEFSWTTSAADVGEEGEYILWFSLTRVGNPDLTTLPLKFSIIDDPDTTGTFTANLVGVTAGERAWLTAALATGNALADYQPLDATLTSVALLGTAADKLAYTTGVDTWAETAITAAGRSVIDDANVAAMLVTLGALALAGGTMAGELVMADQLLTRPVLKDIAETVQALGSLGGGAVEIDLEAGNVVTGTVDTGSTTITFTNWPAATEGGCKLYLTNAGSQTLAFTGVLWSGGTAPTWTASGLDVVWITTPDGGTTKVGAAIVDYQ